MAMKVKNGRLAVPVFAILAACSGSGTADAAACIDDGVGVFVDPARGDDTDLGSKTHPLKTIAAAIDRAGARRRVYLCEGTYREHVTLTPPFSLFGGFACGNWSYAGTKATIVPTTRGFAVRVLDGTGETIVADESLRSVDAVDAGASSIGAYVSSASGVRFRRAEIAAGKGHDGAPVATPPTPYPDAPAATGDAETPNPMCPTSIGGHGGGSLFPAGGAGAILVPPNSGTNGAGGAGGAANASTCSLGSSGGTGLAGSKGFGGTKGIITADLGAIDPSGWKPHASDAGGRGVDGQGGGGGGASMAVGSKGGSGSSGGCGGGFDGLAGGASIALLVFGSTVSLESVLLATDAGGKGSAGGAGQVGQKTSSGAGPSGPLPGSSAIACPGGSGGIGGGGAGGRGGPSVGMLFSGKAPLIDGVAATSVDTAHAVTLGAGGDGGDGGPATVGFDGYPRLSSPAGDSGIVGPAKAVLAL